MIIVFHLLCGLTRNGRWPIAPCRSYGVEIFPPIDLMLKDVADMSDYETFSLVILLIGLVISAITLGITIGKRDKNNRPAEVPPQKVGQRTNKEVIFMKLSDDDKIKTVT